jgi:hypothetical protein
VGAATQMLKQWTACVKKDLLPGLHGHQSKALAAVSLGAALAGHCHSGRVAAFMPGGRAKPASARRRYERLLANPRLRVRRGELPAASGMLARSVLARWAGRPLVLILDETPGPAGLRCLRVSAGCRGRAVPLAWACYREGELPERMPRLVWRLLRRAARGLAGAGVADVTLVADRGLSWPSVLDCCVLLGWHYVLRVQASTRVRYADRLGRAREARAAALARRPGAPRWSGPARVFKKAGWRGVHFTAVREPGCREPWLLASDRPGGPSRHVRNYCKRAWCEQTHRDDKTAGFNWHKSHVTDPPHACRLLLVLALATLLAIGLGARVLKRGLRRELEGRARRTLSLVQLGLRWLRHALAADAPLTPPLFPLSLPP